MIGRVYKITNADESIVYIGSTAESLRRRFKRHTYGFKHFRKHGVDSFSIHLISEHEIENSQQLHEFEQLVIDQTSCVNKNAAYRTKEQRKEKVNQRYQCDKEQRLEKARQYSQANKDNIKARMSERINCGCGYHSVEEI
ncbi:GIY-YIG domain [Phytophthora cactorum]|nr:GIY-YIG domain [Phytophthora cactorum]